MKMKSLLVVLMASLFSISNLMALKVPIKFTFQFKTLTGAQAEFSETFDVDSDRLKPTGDQLTWDHFLQQAKTAFLSKDYPSVKEAIEKDHAAMIFIAEGLNMNELAPAKWESFLSNLRYDADYKTWPQIIVIFEYSRK